MTTFFCHGCGKHRSVEQLAPEPTKAVAPGKRGGSRKQCIPCRDARAHPSGPDDVVGAFPGGHPLLRRHKQLSRANRARAHYRSGAAFKGWS